MLPTPPRAAAPQPAMGRVRGLFGALLLALPLLAPLAVPAAAQPASAWAAVAGPTEGPTRIVGSTNLGCIAGAVSLPPEGPGWQAVRLSRNRHWGHPVLVAAIERLTAQARAKGYPILWIGDMGQPRGGPLPYGHASHQAGLDVDVWLDLNPKPANLSVAARETIDVATLVLPDETDVNQRFTPAHAALIRMAAELPGVDRVLVNHAIKRALCRRHGGESWLRYVRPWRGHDEHMHIRMRCPPGQHACRDIAPPPPGDGCDASLDWWLTEEARHPRRGRPGPPPVMPAACRAILQER